ncbi:MAG: AEC family transporter [Dermatophilaceae bacterium]
MLSILSLTVPIYLVILVGYVAVRRGLFTRADMRVLSQFVVSFALPSLMFLAISSRTVAEILNPTYLTAYAVGTLAAFGLGYTYARLRTAGAEARAFDGLGSSASNSGYVGYPLALLALPSVAGLSLGLNMLVENILLLPLTLVIASSGATAHLSRTQQAQQNLRRLVRNPLLLAVLAGLAVSASGLHLPDVLTRALDLFSRASTATALFAVGGLLAGAQVRGIVTRIAVVSATKLLAHPLLVFAAVLACVAVGMPALAPDLRAALLITAALPSMSVLPVLAHTFGEERSSAGVLLVTTAASFLTLSALLYLLGL